jgi:hypothetical protein
MGQVKHFFPEIDGFFIKIRSVAGKEVNNSLLSNLLF